MFAKSLELATLFLVHVSANRVFDISAAVYDSPKAILVVISITQWAANYGHVTDPIISTVNVTFGWGQKLFLSYNQ